MGKTEYWKLVCNDRNGTGARTHPNRSQVIAILFSYPFSNTSVERLFSLPKDVKDAKRNQLKYESLLSILTTKTNILSSDVKNYADALQPDQKLIRLHKLMTSIATDEDVREMRLDLMKNYRHLSFVGTVL